MNDDEYVVFLKREKIARLNAAEKMLRRSAAVAADSPLLRLVPRAAPTRGQSDRLHFINRV